MQTVRADDQRGVGRFPDGFRWPEGFMWGSATAAHQVEGDNRLNDWWEAEQSGALPFRSGEACRHFELFEQDFDLARSLGQNAHRLSVEWSRIEPDEGVWDEAALDHYRRVVRALRARGIATCGTLVVREPVAAEQHPGASHLPSNQSAAVIVGARNHDGGPPLMVRNLTVFVVASLMVLTWAEGLLRLFPDLLTEEAALRMHWSELGQAIDEHGEAMVVADPDLGFRYAANRTGQLTRGDVAFGFTTDDHGFSQPAALAGPGGDCRRR